MKDFLLPKNLGGTIFDIYEKSRNNNVTVYCANTGIREHIVYSLNKKILYVAPDALQAKMLRDDLIEYGLNAYFLPEKEEILYSQYSYGKNNLYQRIKTLTKLATGNADVVTLSPLALLQLTPRKEELVNRSFIVKVEEEISPDSVCEKLVEAGYQRVNNVGQEGEFSKKGDVIDIFVAGEEFPVRISFFDCLVESIKSFELVTIKPIKVLDKIEILPLSDILVSEEGVEKVRELLTKRKEENVAFEETADRILQKLDINATDFTLSFIMPLLDDEFTSIFSYLSDDYVIVFDDVKMVKEKIEVYLLEHRNRVEAMCETGQALSEHKNALINQNTLLSMLKPHLKLGFMPLQSQNTLFESDYVFKVTSKPTIKYYLEPSQLVSDINTNSRLGNLMVLCADNYDRARAIQNSLRDMGLFVEIVDEITKKTGVFLTPLTIRKSVVYPLSKFSLIGTEELLGKKTAVKKKKRTAEVIKEGDFVVHERHGIGLVEGVSREKVSGGEKDFIVVAYKDNGKLYVPIDQMDLLTKYTGSCPRINKLGGKDFEKVKNRVKQSIKKMAIDLVELYRKREQANGYKYSPDTVWQKEFEDAFEFTETPDQLTAISDVKRDMESGKVMDRLICGDVGFGKTEVAFRAIFKTVIDSRQAVILAPTTILAIQHYKNLKERLAPFNIQIRLMSRLQSNAENKATLEEISTGKVEVVVGTHRLLSKDVTFKNLGLLVLDEEQRFGVEQKEKMKYLAENVNVLTLSATPIPRTLHMAMSGIRDINLLETPPLNRLPIETYVVEYDDGIVVDAINREMARGGQVFVLYNYVESIEEYASKLSSMLGERVRITVAHGQMSADKLEKRIEGFYNGEADVLVCTTIIENGIDLPNANTLIVYDADKFGLSQLHQLRGRVGRSGKLAHAYFTTAKNKVLTSEASQRLVALNEYTEFGSGYQIALKDLQIRGAGNVLGREQHGHMEQVGYELYTKMLREAVTEITTGKAVDNVVTEVKADVNASVDMDIPSDERMALYNKIGDVRTIDDLEKLKNEVRSMYGILSQGVENLINVSLIKALASNIGAEKVIINQKGMGIEFGNVNVFKNPQIIKAVSNLDGKCVLTDTMPIRCLFNVKGLSDVEKIRVLTAFLQDCN